MTAQQVLFCERYVLHLNATKAYSEAFPGATTVNSAAAAASRLLRNVKVQTYIDHLVEKRRRKTEISADRVLAEVARLAFSNVGDHVSYSQYGYRTLVKSEDLDPDDMAAVASVRNKDGLTEIKLHPKVPALKLLMQHLGLLPKDAGSGGATAPDGTPLIPASTVQAAIQAGLAMGPAWMKDVLPAEELAMLFPDRFGGINRN